MKFTNEPVKRTPVVLYLDTDPEHPIHGATDRCGVATFDIPPGSGKVIINGSTRHHGRLNGAIEISLWSPTDAETIAERGTPSGRETGSTAYPGMQIRVLKVNEHEVEVDSEGYLVDLSDWSEAFVRAQAAEEGLVLTDEIWEVIRYLRDFYERHEVQANVLEIIKHFRRVWGPEHGNNRYLHSIFPRGGPQKQGNRLAGLLRTKGEH
jgi:tRNA 2-thiouridine synthesizing protein E